MLMHHLKTNDSHTMKNVFACLLIIPLVTMGGLSSCAGSKMDYGKPVAQFHHTDVPEKAKPYVGKKITIKGTVERVDLSDPNAAWLHLEGGIHCNFGKFRRMAEDNEPGESVYVDGILRRCESGDILLDPAINRDPQASFNPQ